MIQPPFLSHKRTNRELAELLDTALVELGVGAWRDLRSLGLGSDTPRAIRTAINERTGGFIWLGTQESLESDVICCLEIPTALRKRKRSKDYPFVPLFVDIAPDYELVKDSFGRWPFNRRRARRVIDANGIVFDAERPRQDLIFDAACRYQRTCMERLGRSQGTVALHFTSGRRPAKESDLAFDWRDLLEDGWPTDAQSIDRIIGTLRATRRSIQDSMVEELIVSCDLRLPLAALVGWELNAAAVAKLTAAQDLGDEDDIWLDNDTPDTSGFQIGRVELGGAGPSVVAVSVCSEMSNTAMRYASGCGARSLIRVHEPSRLDSQGVKSLARCVRKLLSEINDQGREKHLLLLGPSSLAFWIGREARGTGRTLVPFWDQSSGYNGHVVIGGASNEVHGAVARLPQRSGE